MVEILIAWYGEHLFSITKVSRPGGNQVLHLQWVGDIITGCWDDTRCGCCFFGGEKGYKLKINKKIREEEKNKIKVNKSLKKNKNNNI